MGVMYELMQPDATFELNVELLELKKMPSS
jgi:hypothetical protein